VLIIHEMSLKSHTVVFPMSTTLTLSIYDCVLFAFQVMTVSVGYDLAAF